MIAAMATRERRLLRGRRRGWAVARRTLGELRTARRAMGVSQRAVAAELGMSKSVVCEMERDGSRDVSVVRLCELASVLGYEVAITLHPVGDAIADKGHQALIGRFRGHLAALWRVTVEAPFPALGDARSWDLLVRGPAQLIGVEAETRIRDEQELVRRVRGRERDGGADEILLVLSDSGHNRRLAGELRAALGERYLTSPRRVLGALRRGEALPGSGVVLL